MRKTILKLAKKDSSFRRGMIKKLASEQWIQKAIKRPGALSRALGIPEEENIPMSTINKEISKLHKNEDHTKAETRLLRQLQLAKKLKSMR